MGGAALATGAAAGSVAAAPGALAGTSAGGRVPEGLRPGGELDRYVAGLAAKDEFSGSLLLTRRGKPVLSRSYGMADKAAGVRNGPRTRFGLASLTKMFTSVAVHRLAQQGKVRFDEKVGAYLDGLPAEIADKVTLHHLLTHSSGLGDFHNLPGYREAAASWDEADEVLNGTVEFIKGTRPSFAPGSGHAYSNSAFCLLGAVVAAVSGRSYHAYMAENVFAAAGMADSGFFTKPRWRADRRMAHPYARRPGETERSDRLEEHAFIALPAGGSFATCADLGRFAHALLDDRLLPAPYGDLMLSPKIPMPPPAQSPPGSPPPSGPPPVSFTGYGIITTLAEGQRIHGHGGGSTLGASTSIAIFPDSGWVAAVLCNYDSGAEGVAQLARRLILQDRPRS
ncbi:serine hydrolase domain-containing protein [Spirillospora sp. NPDC047279]|uniref:serine hydrolase domain-containing protein n=1 Tax=Spirillospora sp. NPDC047279 TaxID=3155478 RepID=UPI0033FC88C7